MISKSLARFSPFKRPLLLALPVAFALVACGGEATPPAATPRSTTAKKEPPPAALPPGHLARGALDEVILKNGPPWILRRVAVEDVLRDGKFVGWRVLSMPKEWGQVDLKPGDIVTRVNGMGLERPEDLWLAWTSLTVASDLRVAYERDGASRELAYHIDGEPAKEIPAALRSDEPPPQKPKSGLDKKSTVVIVGDDDGISGD